MGDQFDDEVYGITRQRIDEYLFETQCVGPEPLELEKTGDGSPESEDFGTGLSSTANSVGALPNQQSVGSPVIEDLHGIMTQRLRKKTRRRPKLAGQPFRATYELFLKSEHLGDFQRLVGAGWEQVKQLGKIVQCPSKNNGTIHPCHRPNVLQRPHHLLGHA